MEETSGLRALPPSIQDLVHFLIQTKNVKKIVLFGSRARNQARENSDYDLAVWVNDRKIWSQTLAQVEEKNLTLLPVDLVLYDELTSDYKSNIDREGVLIYE
ncbi:MAG: nucleotidyltransferase family protein [Bdellovibrionales bacterium]